MPKLVTFLPCERVIIAADDNSASVITIFQGFKLGSAAEIPTDDKPLSLPLRWAAFCLWHSIPEDEGITYEQKVELMSPTGKVLISQTAEFAMMKRSHRFTATIFGFPVAGIGAHVLRLSLRATGKEPEYRVISDYPIFVDFDKTAASLAISSDQTSERAH